MKRIDIKTTDKKEIFATASAILARGGLVIFPTETTYGIGADATNPAAIQRLLAYKSKREGKPLSIALSKKKEISEYVFENKQSRALADQFLPGPVTIVCKDKGVVAPGVASEFKTLGIRIPDYPLILELLQEYGTPITATSANTSGKKRPYKIADILENISEKQKGLIDLILDAGELPHNEPSTVIDTTLSTPITLRGKSKNNTDEKQTTIISKSEQETKELAGKLLLKNWNTIAETGLVIALDGSLGVGKTIFTKGVAEFLHISEMIKSPTYSYIEEYDFTRHQTTGRLFHLDMWKVETQDLFERLEIEKLLQPNTVVVIEWFDQIAPFIEPLLKNKQLLKIFISQDKKDSQTQRTIQITE